MSFFYDLNKKLDSIRATPEVTHKQLNERDEGKHNNATTGFKALADKAAKEYGSKAAGERVAGAVHAKMARSGKLEEEEGMSRAAKGYEKYGKQGMEALAKAGREGKALDPVRAKYDKYDNTEVDEGWKGAAIGGALGSLAGPAGALAGAAAGHFVGNDMAKWGKDKKVAQTAQAQKPTQSARTGPVINDYRKNNQGADTAKVGEGAHSQDAMKLNPDFAKIGRKPGVMARVAQGAKKVADFVAPGDEELITRLRRSSPKAGELNYMEAAKYRDPKYKDQLYTQEPLDHTFGPDMDAAYYNNYPDDYEGRKRPMGGDEFDHGDPLRKGFGRGGASNSINTHGKRKGLPSRDQITGLKGSIKDAHGTHTRPNLPEAGDTPAGLAAVKKVGQRADRRIQDAGTGRSDSELANPDKAYATRDRANAIQNRERIRANDKNPTRVVGGPNHGNQMEEGGGIPMTPKQKSFAKLAPPANKITFADKIAGAKKEVDEMLGDVAAEAMKSALGKGKQPVRGMGEATKEIPGGRVHTAEPGGYGRKDDEDDEGKKVVAKTQRGRGRPKNNADSNTGQVMKPDFSAFGVTGKDIKLPKHKGTVIKHKMVGEDDLDPEDQGEYDQEGDMAKDTIKTVVRHAQALEKILGDNDNLPEWVQAKLAKIEGMMTAVDDYMQNQADDDMDDEQEPIAEKAVSKKQQRFMGMVHATQKGKKAPSKEVAKVAKGMNKSDAKDFASTKQKGLPEKAPKKNKEEEVEESTTSGSVATAAPKAAKGSGGFTFGKGIYDSLNRELEGMIAESMSINMSMNNDGNGPTRSLTVTATDEDATQLAQMLKMAGLGGHGGEQDLASQLQQDEHNHDGAAFGGEEVCPSCGMTNCGCNTMDESYGDDAVSQNNPDYPTNTERAQDNFEYSGGLNKPKSTGQTTIPVIAGQGNRTDSYAESEQDALHRMMEMSGIREAKAKPDFLDMDKDGDKQEPMKKAVDDKKTKVQEADTEFNESIRRMREIAGLDKKAVDEEKTEEGNKFTKGLEDDDVKVGDKIPGTNATKTKDIDESIFALTNQWKAYKG